MKNSLIVLGLIFGLLIAGCAAPEQEEPTQPTAPEAPGTGEEPAGPVEQPAEPAEPEEPAEPAEGPEEGLDLAGMEYAALMALGISLECDITTTAEGTTTTAKVYMNGEEEIRTEIPVEESEGLTCTKFVTIVKGKKFYMGCEDGEFMPESDCDWLKFESDEEGESTMVTEMEFESGATVGTDYSDVPPSDIDCRPWIYDSAKFVPVGEICTMEDLMQGYEFG